MTDVKGVIQIEAYDEELNFDGGVSDTVRDGAMLNFYRISEEALEMIVARGQQILMERGLRSLTREPA